MIESCSLFSDVSERFHTPVKTTVFCVAVGALQMLLWRYIPSLDIFAIAAPLGQAGPILVTCIAGIVFPFRAKTRDIYNSSPGSKSKIAGIPAITIAGIIGVFFLSTVIYYWWTVPALGLASPQSLSYVFGVYVVLAVYYFLAKEYRRRQGIDIGLAFKQLPPE